MAKSQTPSKGNLASDKPNPADPDFTDTTSTEPVDLSQVRSGVLHNPPQVRARPDSASTDEE